MLDASISEFCFSFANSLSHRMLVFVLVDTLLISVCTASFSPPYDEERTHSNPFNLPQPEHSQSLAPSRVLSGTSTPPCSLSKENSLPSAPKSRISACTSYTGCPRNSYARNLTRSGSILGWKTIWRGYCTRITSGILSGLTFMSRRMSIETPRMSFSSCFSFTLPFTDL